MLAAKAFQNAGQIGARALGTASKSGIIEGEGTPESLHGHLIQTFSPMHNVRSHFGGRPRGRKSLIANIDAQLRARGESSNQAVIAAQTEDPNQRGGHGTARNNSSLTDTWPLEPPP